VREWLPLPGQWDYPWPLGQYVNGAEVDTSDTGQTLRLRYSYGDDDRGLVVTLGANGDIIATEWEGPDCPYMISFFGASASVGQTSGPFENLVALSIGNPKVAAQLAGQRLANALQRALTYVEGGGTPASSTTDQADASLRTVAASLVQEHALIVPRPPDHTLPEEEVQVVVRVDASQAEVFYAKLDNYPTPSEFSHCLCLQVPSDVDWPFDREIDAAYWQPPDHGESWRLEVDMGPQPVERSSTHLDSSNGPGMD